MGPAHARGRIPRIPAFIPLLLFFGVLCLGACSVPEGCSPRAGEAPVATGGDAPVKVKTMASVLRELADAADPAAFARARGFSLVEGKARVVIRFSESVTEGELLAVASRRSLTVEKRAGGMVRALVPPAELLSLAGEPSVVFIDLPDAPGK